MTAPASPSRQPLRRVVLFFRKLANPGGAERTMFEEAVHFGRRGIDVSILTFSLDPSALFEPPYRVQVTQVGDLARGRIRSLIAEIRNVWLLRRALRRLQPDIVLASSGLDCMALCFATLGLSIPYAAHIHGTIFWFDATYLTSLLRYASIHRRVYAAIRGSASRHRTSTTTCRLI